MYCIPCLRNLTWLFLRHSVLLCNMFFITLVYRFKLLLHSLLETVKFFYYIAPGLNQIHPTFGKTEINLTMKAITSCMHDFNVCSAVKNARKIWVFLPPEAIKQNPMFRAKTLVELYVIDVYLEFNLWRSTAGYSWRSRIYLILLTFCGPFADWIQWTPLFAFGTSSTTCEQAFAGSIKLP